MARGNKTMAGLASVTFRTLEPEAIVTLAAEVGLGQIEWGGDVHVPAGNLPLARRIGVLTRAYGLEVCSYGSYHRLCQGRDFRPVVDTAAALGAPNIRVWAGDKGPDRADDAYFARAAGELRVLCGMAGKVGITVSLEHHRWTLTQTAQAALRLLAAADCPNLRTYWQPNPELIKTEHLAELKLLAPRLSALHVFHWARDGNRLPLAEGEYAWRDYLRATGAKKPLLLEFVRDDDPARLRADAETLLRWEADG